MRAKKNVLKTNKIKRKNVKDSSKNKIKKKATPPRIKAKQENGVNNSEKQLLIKVLEQLIDGPQSYREKVATFRRIIIERCLKKNDYIVGKTAEMLGKNRSTFYRELDELGLNPAKPTSDSSASISSTTTSLTIETPSKQKSCRR